MLSDDLPGIGHNLPPREAILSEIERRSYTRSHLAFTQKFFAEKEGMDFIVSPFHNVLCSTLDRVISGEIKRLVINIFPGAGKTELGIVNFVSRGFAVNPRARFIHLSYSDRLVLDNSAKIRDTLFLEEYQRLWNLRLRADTNAKGLWKTEAGGGILASSSGGTVTGFRAGYMDPEIFTGAMLIDDPLKPDDALSDPKRTHVNARYMNTFKSRLAHEDVPVIVIMQRLHVDDFTAHLLNGGSGEKWHHLVLPVEIDSSEQLESFSHAIPIEHDLSEGPIWEFKHNAESIRALKTDTYTYSSQYGQRPTPLGGALFKESMFERYDGDDLPQLSHRFMVADTAMTAKTSSDYTAVGVFGWSKTGRLYLLEMKRFKKDIPEMETTAIELWKKHKELAHLTPNQRLMMGNLRSFYVENKSSGVGLIQRLRRKQIPVTSIDRDTDKVRRALDATPYLDVNPLMVPREVTWANEAIAEFLAFSPKMTHKHDDQTDVLMDAVEQTMIKSKSMQDVL